MDEMNVPQPTPIIKKSGISISVFVLAIILAVVLSGLATYMVVTYMYASATPTDTSTSTASQEDPTKGWTTYTSELTGFSIKHPSNAKVEENYDGSEGVRIVIAGPTQKSQASYYDALNITIHTPKLNGMTVKEAAEENIQAETAVSSTVLAPLKSTTLHSVSGYTARIKGTIAEYTIYYLERNADNYYFILDSTQDPTGQGFQKTANQILATFTPITSTPTPKKTEWKEITHEKITFSIPQDWWSEEYSNEEKTSSWFLINPTPLPIPSDASPAFSLYHVPNMTVANKVAELKEEWCTNDSVETSIMVSGAKGTRLTCTTKPGLFGEQDMQWSIFGVEKDLYYLQDFGRESTKDVFEDIVATFQFDQ